MLNLLDKRMKEIDKKIEEDAVKRANQAVLEASQESEKETTSCPISFSFSSIIILAISSINLSIFCSFSLTAFSFSLCS